MADNLDDVLALKALAKSARDDGDWEGALSDLQEAISTLQARKAGVSSSSPGALNAELADAYGLVGGVERRWGLSLSGDERQGHLAASVAAYNRGFAYEEHLPPNEANSYNLVNRLVARVLLNPGMLEGIRGDLETAEDILTKQIESARQKDPWAYCDLGTIRLLLGKPDALHTFKELDRLRTPRFVYDSTLATLEPLSKVAGAMRPDLEQAVAQLARSSAGRRA